MSNPLTRWLALNRTVAVVLLSVLLFGLGEELWSPFMPEYLRQQGRLRGGGESAPALAASTLWFIGMYGCLRHLCEGVCFISGGQLTARLGDRGSLFLFGALTLGGYALFLTVGATWAAVVAAVLILGWEPLSVPVTFTTVGATVAKERQGMAFAVQSIQKRLPKILGPLLGGVVLGAAQWAWQSDIEGGIVGMRLLVGVAFALGVASLALQWVHMPHRPPDRSETSSVDILRGMPPLLRRLLAAEVLTRWGDWLARDFVVVYLVVTRGVPIELAGVLFAVQHTTALLTYLPVGQLTGRHGLQPFIGLTFIFFALFPLALALAPDDVWLYAAFVVYGLREIGEPARKALITSRMPVGVRARGVGLYWGVRSFAICSASLVGAWLWVTWGPETMLYAAFGCGCAGTAAYYLGVGARPSAA